MKRVILLLAATLSLLAAFVCAAQADTARDITSECKVSIPLHNGTKRLAYDRNQQTLMICDEQRVHNMTITVGETPLSAVYVEFGKNHFSMEVQQKDGNGKWQTIARAEPGPAQIYAAFAPVTGEVRLRFEHPERSKKLTMSELYLFSEGEMNSAIAHDWQPAVEKADLMVMVAHPDDELLWFSGLIPTYAGEMQKDIIVGYLTCSDSWRELELLNGLWHCGVRTYPSVGSFRDFKIFETAGVYSVWGRKDIRTYMVQQLRQYQPEVVVTHGIAGEYGHGQHIVCAEMLIEAVTLAADESYDPASVKKYGAWQVKKLYLHQGDNPTTTMDWCRPLSAFGGKTGFDVACEAYQMHLSQMGGGEYYEVAAEGTAYDSFVYTLLHSTVGEDTLGGDLFENIP